MEKGIEQIPGRDIEATSNMGLRLAVLEKRYSIHRFSPESAIPERALQGEFYTVSRTEEELSIVCDSEIELEAMESQNNWRIIKIVGPLDFSLTGILAKISNMLDLRPKRK